MQVVLFVMLLYNSGQAYSSATTRWPPSPRRFGEFFAACGLWVRVLNFEFKRAAKRGKGSGS